MNASSLQPDHHPEATAAAAGTRGVAERLLEALMAMDFHPADFTADASSWHNFDEVEIPVAHSFEGMKLIFSVVPDFRFDERRFYECGDVSVAEYVVRGTLPDGSALRAPAALLVTTSGGKISRVREYVDTGQAAKFLAAVGAAAAGPA